MSRINRRDFAIATAAGLAGLATRRAFAAEALPRRYAGVTLNILSRTSPPFDAPTQLGAEFTEATGIKLQVTRVAPSDHYAKLMLDLTSNTNAFDVTLFIYQWKQDLAPFLAELATLNQDVAGAPPLALDDYPPKLLEIYGRVGNKLMGLPILGDVSFLLWNRDRAAAKGIDPQSPPTTWEEVAARGKTMLGDGQYGFALPAGKAPQAYVLFSILFHAFGGQYFDAAGKPLLDSAAGIKTMRFLANDLMAISPPGNLTWDYAEVLNSFSTAKSAQAIMWPGGFATLSDPAKSAVAGKFGMAPPPGGALLGGTSIGINARSKQGEAARLYVAWLTSQEIVTRNAANGTSPARLSALSDSALVAKYPHYPAVKAALLGDTFGYIPMKESEQVLVMMSDEVNAACAKTKTPEQAAADLQTKAVQFMTRRGYLR
jgi:multiple sugar transport system substrate-binding protein